MLHDLRAAFLSLRSRPGATLAAVVCLALGVGVNTIVFGVVDALLFRPPAGVADVDRLVRVRIGAEPEGGWTGGAGSSATFPHYVQAREQHGRVLEDLAAYAPRDATLGAGAGAEPLSLVIATGNYFPVLGVRPHAGRLFGAEEDAAGAAPVAVLGHRFWQSRFGGDSGALGSELRVNGVALTVIGVAPPGFVGVDLGAPDVWIPASLAALEAFGGSRQHTERVSWLQMAGRLRPGIGLEQAQATLRAARATGPWSPQPGAAVPVSLSPLTTGFFADSRGQSPVPLWVLGITAAVLLLACATVANLLLAQAARRGHEIAVRLALGATRARIVRQLLLESGLVALGAAAAAAVLASWSVGLVRLLPVPPIADVVDGRATLFAFAVALATTLLFGVAPALWASRGSLEGVLRRSGGGRSIAGVSRVQHALMAAQVAISFVLLVSALLFVASLRNVQRVDVGYDLDRVLTASVDMRSGGRAVSDPAVFSERVLERVRAVPGVEAASTGGIVPFYMLSRGSFQIPDGRPEKEQPSSLLVNAVGTDYIRAMGLEVQEGRAFTAEDRAGAPPVALLARGLARELWPDGSPLGRCIRLSRAHGDACVRIVGIVGDARYEELRGEPSRVLYLPAAQQPGSGAGTFFVRVRGEPGRVAGAVRAEIQSLDPALPFVQVEPLDARARPQRLPWEVAAVFFTFAGALAALIATAGLYMVVAFVVAQRRRELGVRAALGASPGALLRLVLGHGVGVTAVGVAAGAVLALGTTRVFASRLVEISVVDPRVYLAVAAMLAAAALLASYIPARTAARVDPVHVLREE